MLVDGGPTLNQHCGNVWCLMVGSWLPSKRANFGLMLGHRLRRWPNIELKLAERKQERIGQFRLGWAIVYDAGPAISQTWLRTCVYHCVSSVSYRSDQYVPPPPPGTYLYIPRGWITHWERGCLSRRSPPSCTYSQRSIQQTKRRINVGLTLVQR